MSWTARYMEVNALVASYAYAANVPVMLNTAPSAPVDSDLLAHVSYISPNEHEAADLSGIPVVDEASAMRHSRMDRVCALLSLPPL